VRWLLLVTGLLISLTSPAQPRTDPFLNKLLKDQKDSLLQHVLNHPEIYRYQFIYTKINRDAKNNPTLTNYYYQFDSLRYFNPASTVKLPLALLSLEKFHTLEKYGVNMYTSVLIDRSYSGQSIMHKDSTSENGLPSNSAFYEKSFSDQ